MRHKFLVVTVRKWLKSVYIHGSYRKIKQEKPSWRWQTARLKRMQKLLQFDVFRFILPNSISPNFKLPMH